MPANFFFAIPFISAKISKDFRGSCASLRATLDSCISQIDMENVEIAVCCHEMPPSIIKQFPDVTFIDAPLGPPRIGAEINELRYDKMSKLKRLAVHAHNAGGGHFMMLDADDIVSSQLVHSVRLMAPSESVLLNGGYVASEPRQVALDMMKDLGIPLWEGCGSCLVAFLAKADLPSSMVDSSVYRFFNRLSGHKTYRSDFKSQGRPLLHLDEPMVIYVRDHGSNLTMILNGGEHKVFDHPAAKNISDIVGENFKMPAHWTGKQHHK